MGDWNLYDRARKLPRTKGEWKAVVSEYKNHLTGDGGVSCHLATEGGTPLPFHAGQNMVKPEEAIANAMLTAAAAELFAFALDVASNYDCDSDAHRHGNSCRKCEAEALLRLVVG